jgi:hypothetical protein
MFYASYDESWYADPMYIWTAVEIDLGLVSQRFDPISPR